jgi:hypothetical protein
MNTRINGDKEVPALKCQVSLPDPVCIGKGLRVGNGGTTGKSTEDNQGVDVKVKKKEREREK